MAFSASDTRWRWKSPFPPQLGALECSLSTRVCPPAWTDEIFLFNPKSPPTFQLAEAPEKPEHFLISIDII